MTRTQYVSTRLSSEHSPTVLVPTSPRRKKFRRSSPVSPPPGGAGTFFFRFEARRPTNGRNADSNLQRLDILLAAGLTAHEFTSSGLGQVLEPQASSPVLIDAMRSGLRFLLVSF